MLMRKEREKMKKVLVLVAVLSMASLANAAILLSVNGEEAPPEIILLPSQSVTIDVTATDGGSYLLYVDILLPAPATVSNVRQGPAVGNMDVKPEPFAFSNLGTYMELGYTHAWAPPPPDPVAGTFLLFDLHCDGPGDVVIQLWDDAMGYTTPADVLVIHQVPEPATLAILGLGALLLRRK